MAHICEVMETISRRACAVASEGAEARPGKGLLTVGRQGPSATLGGADDGPERTDRPGLPRLGDELVEPPDEVRREQVELLRPHRRAARQGDDAGAVGDGLRLRR